MADVPSYLSICDTYISSSQSEGMPNAALEALACGLNAFVTAIPPHYELKRNVGLGVDLFEFKDESQLYNLILSYAEYENFNRKNEIRNAVELKYGTDQMARAYEKIYLNVVK